jgi:hypothetical protein
MNPSIRLKDKYIGKYVLLPDNECENGFQRSYLLGWARTAGARTVSDDPTKADLAAIISTKLMVVSTALMSADVPGQKRFQRGANPSRTEIPSLSS